MDLKGAEEFLRNKTYLKGILKDKGKKSDFGKACKNFSIFDGDLMYKEKRRVVFEVERRTAIIHDVHEGTRDNSMAKALKAHRGRESTYQKISEQFFWHGMIEDIKEYIQICKSCQQQGKISPELKSIPSHEMTGSEQRITSAYHHITSVYQSNGLYERQNRTIKDSLVKGLEENIIDGPISLMVYFSPIG